MSLLFMLPPFPMCYGLYRSHVRCCARYVRFTFPVAVSCFSCAVLVAFQYLCETPLPWNFPPESKAELMSVLSYGNIRKLEGLCS